MALTFLEPRWLALLLVAVPAVWAVRLASAASARRGLAAWSPTVMRTLVVAGVILAVAHPVRVQRRAAVSAVAVVDVSASVADTALARAQTFVGALAAAAHPPHELHVVTFAQRPILAPPLTSAVPPLARQATTGAADTSMETDIARALGLAAGLGDPTAVRRVALLSDGRATRGDALAQAAHLARQGIRVDIVDVSRWSGGPGSGDVAVDGLGAPEVQPRAPFPLTVRLISNRPARARLTLRRDGTPVGTPRLMAVPAGATTVEWNTQVEDSRPAVFTVDVRTVNESDVPVADAHAENDQGVLAVAPRTRPRVLLVAGAAADAAALTAALAAQAIDTDFAAAGRAAAAFAAGALERADLVVVSDVPRAALSDAALSALSHYVRDGGGLLVTGGPRSFGAGNWDGSPLAPLLPVRMDSPARRDEPALALALVIDRSGSMSGPKMELTREAARNAAGLLPPDDQLAVIAFDSAATTVVPLQRAANRMRIFNDLGRIQPTGGTNILAGLREGIEALNIAHARKKHVILLTDGQSATDGIAELVDAAAGSGITVSAVGVGDGADDNLLQSIARRGNGRYYRARDPATIPRIFTRETSEVASTTVVERATGVVPRARVALLAGLPLERAPRLDGHVRTRPRADAELLLSTDDGDPLLARWSVGLGQVAAWTSDLGPRWAAAWARWPAFEKFWGQVARGTMRSHAARRAPLEARLDGDVAEVTVDAVSDDDRFLSGLDGRLEIRTVSKGGAISPAPTRVAMTESAPGRYQARLELGGSGEGGQDPSARPAALLLHAVLAEAGSGKPAVEAAGQLSAPVAPELRPDLRTESGGASGAALLAAIAARTGGGGLIEAAALFRDAPPRITRQSLRTPLLMVVVALFIGDVALRRLRRRPWLSRQRRDRG